MKIITTFLIPVCFGFLFARAMRWGDGAAVAAVVIANILFYVDREVTE